LGCHSGDIVPQVKELPKRSTQGVHYCARRLSRRIYNPRTFWPTRTGLTFHGRTSECQVGQQSRSGWFQTDFVVNRISESLLAGDMAPQLGFELRFAGKLIRS
jgi:hypothetical protein